MNTKGAKRNRENKVFEMHDLKMAYINFAYVEICSQKQFIPINISLLCQPNTTNTTKASNGS
jgi:hypothetical protein